MPTTAMMIEALVQYRSQDAGAASTPPDYFWQLVERFRADLINQAFAILGNQVDAEDVAQESLCESFEALAQLKDPRQLGVWMRQINRRNALDLLRTRKSEQEKIARARKDSGRHTLATGGYSGVDLRELVARIVDSMPDELREVVVLRYWEHLDYRQISERLGLPLGTVKSQLFRADAMLEQRLRKHLESYPQAPRPLTNPSRSSE